MKVTLTRSAELDPSSLFFALGEAPKLVYTSENAAGALAEMLGSSAEVVASGSPDVALQFVLSNLYSRGVRRLLVEGGADVGSQFINAGLVDQLRIALTCDRIADVRAPRLFSGVSPMSFANHRLRLDSVERLDQIVVLNYQRSP